jgi:PPK2 family polyphosphate:nucleotide phosphotransferase
VNYREFIKPFVVPHTGKVDLKRDYDPNYADDSIKKKDADELLAEGVAQLAAYQDKLYAQSTHALLLIFQAMDAAGKDSAIKHVMSGLNPQGTQVFSFKAPSTEELDHDYLWRNFKALPERGRIGIFNRSYYEEVLVVRVHPQILAGQSLPPELKDDGIWARRYDEINHFEEYLTNNGITVVKFFLNVSRREQKERFLERIDQPEKNWKFSMQDVKERGYWADYQAAYEDMLCHTSTRWAPWHVIPADRKWFTRLAVAATIIARFEEIDPRYPEVTDAHRQELLQARSMLEAEEA